MELAEIRPFEPQMAEIDLFTMPDAVGVGEPSVRKVKPYISGHVTDGSSTFTFKVNNVDVTVPVDANGDWKYKPTAAITSLAFVGVPQLESLELNKITGVSTFNLDYPVVPVFKKCDATTEAALDYVYHIRGTATENFSFSLKYITGGIRTEVTENAVVDENGKWDISYSGKKINDLGSTFLDNTKIVSIEFTDPLDELTTLYKAFTNCSSLTSLKGFGESKFNKVSSMANTFQGCKITQVDMHNAELKALTNFNYTFYNANAIEILDLSNVQFDSVTTATSTFPYMNSLTDLYVPNNSEWDYELYFKQSPLTYESMLRIAGWLKDLTDGTAQTVTFRKATYDALTAEQQAALTAIIVTEKGWNLATA